MKNRSLFFTACAVLTVVLMLPAVSHAGTGTVICSYKFHQHFVAPVNDLHLVIRISQGTTLLGVDDVMTDPDGIEGWTIHGDNQGFDVDISWGPNIPRCTWVKVAIKIRLKGTVCTNQQSLIGSWWTFNSVPVGPTKMPPHRWFFFRRYFTTGGEFDVYPFRLVNLWTGAPYVRDLQFRLGPEDFNGFELMDLVDWDPTLYTGGDFFLAANDSVDLDLTTDRWIYPPHVQGAYQLWSGSEPGDSLLGECWLQHYDYEPSLAAQMADVSALNNGDGTATIKWNTLSEIGVAGFNVYRGTSEEKLDLKVNESLIPARGGTMNGADYVFTDTGVDKGSSYYYWIEDYGLTGETFTHGPYLASGKEDSPDIFALHQNYPNPFNPNTRIDFNLAQDCHVRIEVYNILGQRVASLKDGFEKAGLKSVFWDGKDNNGSEVSSGVYFYKMTAGQYTEMKKMILLR